MMVNADLELQDISVHVDDYNSKHHDETAPISSSSESTVRISDVYRESLETVVSKNHSFLYDFFYIVGFIVPTYSDYCKYRKQKIETASAPSGTTALAVSNGGKDILSLSLLQPVSNDGLMMKIMYAVTIAWILFVRSIAIIGPCFYLYVTCDPREYLRQMSDKIQLNTLQIVGYQVSSFILFLQGFVCFPGLLQCKLRFHTANHAIGNFAAFYDSECIDSIRTALAISYRFINIISCIVFLNLVIWDTSMIVKDWSTWIPYIAASALLSACYMLTTFLFFNMIELKYCQKLVSNCKNRIIDRTLTFDEYILVRTRIRKFCDDSFYLNTVVICMAFLNAAGLLIVLYVSTFDSIGPFTYNVIAYMLVFSKEFIYLFLLIPEIAKINDESHDLRVILAESDFCIEKEGLRIFSASTCNPISYKIAGAAFTKANIKLQLLGFVISFIAAMARQLFHAMTAYV